MEPLFEKLPYDTIEEIKPMHLMAGAAALGLLLIVLYYFTLYGAAQEEIASLEQKKVQNQRTLKQYQALIQKEDTVAQELARAVGDLDAMKNQLPRGKDLPELLKNVADFGRGRGQFEVLRFRLEEGEVKDFYKVIPVSIRMRGSFWDTLDFVDSMQNLLQLVNFSDLSMGMRRVPIAQTGGGGGAVQTNLLYTDFVASTYAYIEDSENKGGKG